VILAPARLDPCRVPRIWGVHSLQPFFPDAPGAAEPVGEVWLTGDACRFANGPYAGQTLGEAWPRMPTEWTGTRIASTSAAHARIPLLAKFIFPADKLSVQVHPDDAYAQEHEQAAGGVGKTEMWYVAKASAGATIRVGLRSNVTRESFARSIDAGTAEDCLQPIAVRAGDTIFIPAGTAHSIGPGVVLYEMQQHSDLTYRVFDYNRVGADGKTRELHVKKAMDVLRFDAPISTDARAGRVVPIALSGGPDAERLLLVACRYFAVERWEFARPVTLETSPERFELLTSLRGTGRIAVNHEFTYAPGQAWLVPAALGSYTLEPTEPTTLLRSYVPNLEALEQELAGDHAHTVRP
jgi:mannose-6-phosphate isomerase